MNIVSIALERVSISGALPIFILLWIWLHLQGIGTEKAGTSRVCGLNRTSYHRARILKCDTHDTLYIDFSIGVLKKSTYI